ncbi:sigma-70 family RNA polymerase sigma factor [Salininema proteolyticum]|uniref:Sigma-70 family RNA polymerase sigma factor n=1 Tax=Salininema proteolyticum TaxID=1607685 RepID=A0ABV8U2A1_9ACTN
MPGSQPSLFATDYDSLSVNEFTLREVAANLGSLKEAIGYMMRLSAPSRSVAERGEAAPAGARSASGTVGEGRHRQDDSVDDERITELVERAQGGDSEAFGEIYDHYSATVYRYIYFRVNSVPLAEDLASEAFVRALRRISSFKWQGRAFGAWLITIARNLVVDYYKSGRYRLEIAKSEVIGADQADTDATVSPETAALDKLTNATLLTAVKKLNPDQQECIVLRFLQGFSVAETARAMGKNEGAVKALQYRAVRTLARLLPDGFHG